MLTVLIVDDNVGFRAQAARLCAAEGFSTVSAGSLSELATVLSTSAPDLALVDIELPQIPGHRLGALIRSRQKIPIVLVSALMVVLFFGGWQGPWLPPIVWFALKTGVFLFLFILFRAALPRPRMAASSVLRSVPWTVR